MLKNLDNNIKFKELKGRAGYICHTLDHYSPEIMSAAGTILIGAGFISSIKETEKFVREAENEEDTNLFKVFKKHYLKPTAFTTSGICLMWCGLVKEKKIAKRYAALAAAATTNFAAYREAVRKEIGEEEEERIFDDYFSPSEQNEGVNINTFAYIKFVDETSSLYVPGNPEKTYYNVRMAQEACVNTLMYRGYIRMNDIWTTLGFPNESLPETGWVDGWIYDTEFDPWKQLDFGLTSRLNEKFDSGESDVVAVRLIPQSVVDYDLYYDK